MVGHRRGALLEKVDEGSLPSWSSTTAHNLRTHKLHRSVQQFTRGVLWPDDPEGLLFDEPVWMENFSMGIKWLRRFKADKAKDPKNLTARSHFGDLQFLHGMATKSGLAASTTRGRMLKWARFLVEVATGSQAVDDKVKDVPYLKRLLAAKKYQGWSVGKFLGSGSSKPTRLHIRQRAVGALFHLMQDSCAGGHVMREPDTFEIRQFLNYGEQDEDKHGADDVWAQGSNLSARVRNTLGANEAVTYSTRVVAMIDQGRPTKAVMDYLSDVVFPLSSDTLLSDSGDGFS